MNRRNFIRGAAGLLVAAGAGELLLPERRVWALDRTMIGPTYGASGFSVEFEQRWMETYRRLVREWERHIIFGEPLSPELAKHVHGSDAGIYRLGATR